MPIKHRVHQTTINTGEMVWGPMAGIFPNFGSATTNSLNDADNEVRGAFAVPRSGSITHIGMKMGSVVGSPPAYTVALLDMAGDTYGGSAAASHTFTTEANSWVWIALPTPATATVGDMVQARICPGATAPDGSNYVQVVRAWTTWIDQHFPQSRGYTTGWSAYGGLPVLAAKYSDGSVATPGFVGTTYDEYRTNSTPDEAGNLFTLPFGATCNGMVAYLYPTQTAADYTACLYDAANTLLASVAVDVSAANLVAVGAQFVHWTPVTLAANTSYRATILPSSTSIVRAKMQTFPEVASREWFTEGARWQGTTRTDAGAWTDDPLSLFGNSLLLSSITVTE